MGRLFIITWLLFILFCMLLPEQVKSAVDLISLSALKQQVKNFSQKETQKIEVEIKSEKNTTKPEGPNGE